MRGAERAYLAGGALQLLIAKLRCDAILFSQREESAEPKRFFKECHRGVERTLLLCDREWDLLGKARSDVEVGAHAEGVEAQRLLPLAGYGNNDRGPFDLVRFAAGRPPVRMKQYLELRPGIDLVPAAPVLGHRLLHPRSLHHAPPFSKANVPQGDMARNWAVAPTIDFQATARRGLARRHGDMWQHRQQLDLTGSIEHRLNQTTVEERIKDAEELAERVRRRPVDAGIVIEHEPEE